MVACCLDIEVADKGSPLNPQLLRRRHARCCVDKPGGHTRAPVYRYVNVCQRSAAPHPPTGYRSAQGTGRKAIQNKNQHK
ncbi:hypothetical protein EYF80_008105 [Liparis tanakae]|uniref:Uncharacterized protein n=1 Tax=Liparis tanakae TaxID=230148 RepID=A0A4Z2IUH1_9TELE|nr:hypothetical protein EYF80_008105 [Liparis tanakae]